MSPYSSLILRLDTTVVKKSQSVVLAYMNKSVSSQHIQEQPSTSPTFCNQRFLLMNFCLASEYSGRVGWGSFPPSWPFLTFLAGAAFCLGDTPAFALGFTPFAFGLTGGFALLASAANNRCLWGFIGIVGVEKTLFVTFSGSKWEQVGTVLGTSTT